MSNVVTLNSRTGLFNKELETLDDLYEAMSNHDYTHMMSDDPRVWRSGQADSERIQRAVTRLGYEDLWQKFLTWGWRTRDMPKPDKPEEFSNE